MFIVGVADDVVLPVLFVIRLFVRVFDADIVSTTTPSTVITPPDERAIVVSELPISMVDTEKAWEVDQARAAFVARSVLSALSVLRFEKFVLITERNEFAVIQSFKTVIVLIYLRDYSSRPIRRSKSGNVSGIIPELSSLIPSVKIVPYTCYNRGYSICNTCSCSSSRPRSGRYGCSGSPRSWWHMYKVYENHSHNQGYFIVFLSIQELELPRMIGERIKALLTFFQRLVITQSVTLYPFDFRNFSRVSSHFGHTYSTQFHSL